MIFCRGTETLSFHNPNPRHGKPASLAAPGTWRAACARSWQTTPPGTFLQGLQKASSGFALFRTNVAGFRLFLILAFHSALGFPFSSQAEGPERQKKKKDEF